MSVTATEVLVEARRRHGDKVGASELGTTYEELADSIADKPGCRTIPFAEWSDDDPIVDLARRYGLTPADLARLFTSAADQMETRAMNTGYPDAWID